VELESGIGTGVVTLATSTGGVVTTGPSVAFELGAGRSAAAALIDRGVHEAIPPCHAVRSAWTPNYKRAALRTPR